MKSISYFEMNFPWISHVFPMNFPCKRVFNEMNRPPEINQTSELPIQRCDLCPWAACQRSRSCELPNYARSSEYPWHSNSFARSAPPKAAQSQRLPLEYWRPSSDTFAWPPTPSPPRSHWSRPAPIKEKYHLRKLT